MKIAVNTRFLIKGRLEGMGLFTYEVVRRLVEQHSEHTFIFFFDRPYDPSFVFGKNVEPVVLFPPARHPFLFVWWFEWSVVRALEELKPDVFLSPDNFLSLRAKLKTVLVTHDIAHAHFPEQVSFFHRKYYQFFAPKFNRKAQRIVTVSHFTKQDLIRQYQIQPSKIAVACNGCRPFFQPLAEAEKRHVREQYADLEPYFFYVGAVHPRKNVHRLIAAFDQFKQRTETPVKLLVAGRFAWKAGEVKAAFEASSFKKDIKFLGYVEDTELARLMGAAFACTYISQFEGFGVPVLEAMYCDVPVITSNTSSLPEVVGEAGLLVDPYSVGAIAGAMESIWEDENLRADLIEKGKLQRQKFTWQKAADIVYENLKIAARP